MMGTKIISAFCGCGKSFICDTYHNISVLEYECWKYDSDSIFPINYIEDIKSQIGEVDYIFISTNPIVLKELFKQGIKATLIYPNIKLKCDYIERYENRGSSFDFIKMLDSNWEKWINELKDQSYLRHIVLEKGEYISDHINNV